MKEEQGSDTALLIAASLVLLSHDPKYSRIVSKADFPARVLQVHSARARWFAESCGHGWFRVMARLIEHATIPGILLHYALRKECIARLARSALDNGARQIVIIGAGFDGLSFALHEAFPSAHIWEIDHPATQREKAQACGGPLGHWLHFLPLDLNTAPIDKNALIATGFGQTQRTFWIVEGLLMYLRAEIVSALMMTLHDLSSDGSAFAFTFMEKQSDGSIRFHSQSALVDWWLRRRGEPFLWGATRTELADSIRPWRIMGFFDHNDLRMMEPALAHETLAEGEVICLAEMP